MYNPRPIFSLAQTDRYRVRAEVDENDVGRVLIGQRVWIAIEASSVKRFWGTVVKLGSAMGRRHILTSDPADKSDRDVLEVIIEIDENQVLPIGLRVAVMFERS